MNLNVSTRKKRHLRCICICLASSSFNGTKPEQSAHKRRSRTIRAQTQSRLIVHHDANRRKDCAVLSSAELEELGEPRACSSKSVLVRQISCGGRKGDGSITMENGHCTKLLIEGRCCIRDFAWTHCIAHRSRTRAPRTPLALNECGRERQNMGACWHRLLGPLLVVHASQRRYKTHEH